MILATRKYHEECGQPLKWPKPGEKYGSKYRGMPLPGAHRQTIPVCLFWEEADHEMSVHTKLPAAGAGAG